MKKIIITLSLLTALSLPAIAAGKPESRRCMASRGCGEYPPASRAPRASPGLP